MDLLERQSQLDELARHVRECGTGAGKVVFVSGEAGAGKSALVELFAGEPERRAQVVWGHCDALQTSRVLGAVHEVLAGTTALGDAAREYAGPREQLFARLLEKLSPPHPLRVVVLEDLHWADEATLDFVRFLGRRIQRTRCLLIATYRDDELALTHPLRGVLGEITGQHTARIRLPPLSFDAVEQLAVTTSMDARHVYQVTGGNPFFVRELLTAPLDTVPETVRDAVLARFMQCSQDARDLAEIVALSPGKTPHELTSAVLGNFGEAADEAVERGLLRYQDEALAFRHELGRLAIEGSIPRARAQALHRRVLRILMEHGADVSQLVHHASRAQDVEALLKCAPVAARQAAAAGAHREAVAHLEMVLRHAGSIEVAERARLYELHATECDTTNQVEQSLHSANEALVLWRERGDVAAQARVLLLISRQHWKAGQTELADRSVTESIQLLEAQPAGRDLAMAYSARSQRAMTSDDTPRTLLYGCRALALAEQFKDNGVRAHSLNNIGSALLSAGNPAGLAKLEESLAVALQHNLQEHAGRAYANLVSVSVGQHLTHVGQRYVPEAIEYCESHEVQDCLSYARAYGAHFELNMGRWDRAAQAAMKLIDHPQVALAQRVPALVVLASVRARRGDPGVDELVDEAMRLAQPTGELQRIGRVAATRAEIAWYRGDLKRVKAEAAVGLQAAAGHPDRWTQGELAYWMHCADPSFEITVDIAEPYAFMIEGDWQHAAHAWERLSMPYEWALALAEGPEAALREALGILESLEARPMAAIVRQRLRELGARAIPRGPRSTTRENPAGLTSREIQVLALLAQGHTNRQLAKHLHISTKTVDNHVSSILDKLAVHTRTEAVATAFGMGIVKA